MNADNPYRPAPEEILPLAIIAFMLVILVVTAKVSACTEVAPAPVAARDAVDSPQQPDHTAEIEQLRAEIQELHQRTTTLRCLALFQGDRTRAKPPRTWDWQGWDWDGEVWRDSQCGDMIGGTR